MHQTPSHGPELIDAGSVLTLGSIASFIDVIAPHPTVPDDKTLGDLRTQIASVIDEVLNAEDLPDSVRKVILHRIHDVLWALDHIQIAGPDGVAAALERLAGAMLINAANAPKLPVWKVLGRVVVYTYAAFMAGPRILEALEAWGGLYDALPPGP